MTQSITDRRQAVNHVLVLTLILNLVVAAAKLAVGLLTRSLAMVADGIHSTIDSSSNVIGLLANAIAARPPDQNHPYGHRRFETVATLAIGGLLLFTAYEIVTSSIERLRTGGTPDIGPMNFIAMLGTLAINLFVSVYEQRAGRRLNAEILIADAKHTRSDVWVSLSVLGSLVAVWLGWVWVDVLAALVVVVLIGWAALEILSGAVNVLADRAPLEAGQVESVIRGIPGVEEVVRVRSRGPIGAIHLDLDLKVNAATTADRAEAISREIRERLHHRFSGLEEIQVYFVPQRQGPRDYALVARAEADALSLSIHEVIVTQTPGGLTLEMHVEVNPALTVAQAHDQVSELEARLRHAIPETTRVLTHIEPAHTGCAQRPPGTSEAHDLAEQALTLARTLAPEHNWHNVDIRREPDDGYAVSMHCHVSGDMLLEDAHRMAEMVETQIRAMLPVLHRVTIHTEPPDG